MDRASLPQTFRPIRLHGSGIARRAASHDATGRAEGLLNAPLVGAQHRRDVLHLVTLGAKHPRSVRLVLAQLSRPGYIDAIENDPGNGVSESSHTKPPSKVVAAVVPSSVGVRRRHSEGRFVDANRSSSPKSRSTNHIQQNDSVAPRSRNTPGLFMRGKSAAGVLA